MTAIFERKKPARRLNSLVWIFDSLEFDPGYMRSRMFGCETAYMDGRLCLAVADRREPWNGLLVCTSHEHHAALMKALPALRAHGVLGKWLYVSQDDPRFEETAERLTALVSARDPRVGVEPKAPRRQKLK